MDNSLSNHAEELAQFAQMVGYQAKPSENGAVAPQADKPDVPLLDQEDISLVDDYAGATKTQAWSNPFAKLAVVGAIAAILVGGVALFVASADHIRQSGETASSIPAVDASPSPTPTPTDQVGDLKTQTALETQAEAIHAASKPQPVASNATPAPTALPHTPPDASRTLPRYSPRSTAPVPSLRSSGSTSTQKIDPMQVWQSAQQLGSYGQVEYASAVQAPSTEEVSTAQASPPSAADTGYQQQQYQADEDAIISGTSRQFSRITTGAIASGNLETPLIWAQDLDTTKQPQRFAMTLTQPLIGADGSVALPSGSVIILSIDGVDQSGLVSLSPIGAVVQKDGTQKLIGLPPGALTVEGTNGKPLLAQQYNGVGRQIAHLDRSLAIMGGLAGLGRFVTSPTSSTLSQGLTSTVSSSASRGVNAGTIIGSILDGAFSTLQQQVSQRDTQEIQSLLNRPDVWYVPEGQPLQVFVNSSFEVAL